MRAVLYVRVSTKEQVSNLSLPAQEAACRRFCQEQSWTVDRVFVERGESAKTVDRTALKELLAHCRESRGRVDVMVVYSLDRFARNNYDHYAVRALLAKLGMTLRSVTQPIDESPTGKLMEGVLAAIAQFDNDVRAEKTVTGMREALSRGRWTFQAPLGYRNVARDGVKTIEPDPETAPLIEAGFRLMATGLSKKAEVLAELTRRGLRTKRGERVSPQSWDKILANPLYAGRVSVPSLGVEAEGDFEPLVPWRTFQRVQEVLAGAVHPATTHVRQHPDFPLRRFVRCAPCGRPLTGSWSRSQTERRYGYYTCKSCGRNDRKEHLEERFLELLRTLEPEPRYLAAIRERILELWQERRAAAAEDRRRRDWTIRKLERRKKRLLDAFVYREAIDEATYRQEVELLQEQETIARLELHDTELEELDVEAVLAFAEQVVGDAVKLWTLYGPPRRQLLQKALFPQGLDFEADSFRTPVTTLFFRPLEPAEGDDPTLVSPSWWAVEPLVAELTAFRELRRAQG